MNMFSTMIHPALSSFLITPAIKASPKQCAPWPFDALRKKDPLPHPSPLAGERENGPKPASAQWKSALALAFLGWCIAAPSLAADTQELDKLKAEVRGRGWVVFGARTEAGDHDLFVMRPDGSERRQLTHTAEFNEAGPRFSRDGKRLLYYRMPKSVPVDLGGYGTTELVLANADGSDPVVYGKEFRWASWGPDGRQIACLAQKEIQIVDVTTREVVKRIPRKGLASQLLWSPDGKKFIGRANGLGEYWNIGCLDVETGQIVGIGDPVRYNCTPDYTADAKFVVYAHGIVGKQPGRAELWVGDVAGTERHRLYALPDYHIYCACASPDGEYLLFTRSVEDLGQPKTAIMGLIRWPKTPQPADTSSILRLDLGPGFETVLDRQSCSQVKRCQSRSILACGSPLPLSKGHGIRRRQRTVAVQDASPPPSVPGLWILAWVALALLLVSCGKPAADAGGAATDPHLATNGMAEVTAQLVEIPEGAVFRRGMYDYATVLKYRVLKVHRGQVEGDTIYVAHYDPWKPRSEAADRQVPNIGGDLQQFQAGQIHHLALEVPVEDFFLGGLVNKYFGRMTNAIYWAVWTNRE